MTFTKFQQKHHAGQFNHPGDIREAVLSWVRQESGIYNLNERTLGMIDMIEAIAWNQDIEAAYFAANSLYSTLKSVYFKVG